MKELGIQGVRRGQPVITTRSNPSQPSPCDRVNRVFRAQRPNPLWVADFTDVPSAQGTVYTAFITDVFARKIVGWQVETSMTASLVLQALDQAFSQRRPPAGATLIHHSDRGSQYLSLRYTQRLIQAGIAISVGSRGG